MTELQSGLSGDQRESLEAACQCITSATGVQSNDQSNKPEDSLSSIYSIYQVTNASINQDPKFAEFLQLLKSKDFFKGLTQGSKQYNDRLTAAKKKWIEKQSLTSNQPKVVTEADKAAAEQCKAEGNAFLSQAKFEQAIEKYTQSINLNPHNAIYFANRAAAHINLSNFEPAVTDCQSAIALDEKYAKAHYRLGSALFNLERYSESIPAYERALELTVNDPSMHETISAQLSIAQSKLNGDSDVVDTVDGDEDDSAEGGFDMSALLNNPMLSKMAESFGGGGMDFSALLNNPMVQQMAQNMFSNMGGMGSMGGMAGANPAPSSSPSSSAAAPDFNSFLQSDAAASLISDPDVGPAIEDIRKNGQSAVFKHMSNPKFMAKIQQMMQKPSK